MSERREVTVSREWFERLEDYLRADERFTSHRTGIDLILETPEGKRLVFVPESE